MGDLTWFRVGLALAFSGQGMVFGLGYNNALRAGEAPAYGSLAYALLHGVLMVSALIVVAMLGVPLLRSAVAALRARQVTVEALFLLTATGAFCASLLSTLRGEGSVYYEVVGLVLVIYTVGRKVGARTRTQALAAANHWRERFAWAYIATASGNRRRVPVATLTSDDRVVVLPGESVPVDGAVTEGRAEVQETVVTGELVPVLKRPGDALHAGSHALDGRLEIAPTVGKQRLLDGILAAIETAVVRPSRFQTQADRLMRWFLPFVLSASAGTFSVWWLGIGLTWPEALFNAMAVLLVACPCALGLATPIAVWTGLLSLSKRGLVSRDGQLLEALANTRTWFFDKTGTLSEAELQVEKVEVLADDIEVVWLTEAVASVEALVSHPLAAGLAAMTAERRPVKQLRVFLGDGVEAVVEGRRLRVGRTGWIETDLPAGDAGVVVEVALDGRHVGRIFLAERIPAARAEALGALAATGAAIRILSGDPKPSRADIGGVAVEGGLRPEAKVEIVRTSRKEDPYAIFVGDGLNDAAALAAAPIGIALQGGADLSQASAAGILLSDRIEVLPWAVHFCRRLQARLRGNLVFALSYNLIGISLAAFGLLHPVVAALLMVGSSVIVSSRAARISRWAERESEKSQHRAS